MFFPAPSITDNILLFMVFVGQAATKERSGNEEDEDEEDEDYDPRDKEDEEEDDDIHPIVQRFENFKKNGGDISDVWVDNSKPSARKTQQDRPEKDPAVLAEAFARELVLIRDDPDNLVMLSSDVVIYQFSDSTNQIFAVVDIFVPALLPEYFEAKIVPGETDILELAMITPTSMFLPKRLTSKGLSESDRLDKEDARVKSFASEGQKILEVAQDSGMLKKIGVLGQPLRIQLPFHVEKEFVSTKLSGHNHDEKELSDVGQGMFIYTIVVENVAKPRKLKIKQTFMTLVSSPHKGDSDDSDEGDEIKALASQSKWRVKQKKADEEYEPTPMGSDDNQPTGSGVPRPTAGGARKTTTK